MPLYDEIHKTDTHNDMLFWKNGLLFTTKSYVLDAVVEQQKQKNKTQLIVCIGQHCLQHMYEWKVEFRNAMMSVAPIS